MYIVRRVIQGILTVFVVTIIIFLLFKAMPGSPLTALLQNPSIPKVLIAKVANDYGLNDPPWIQLYKYLLNMFTFNFGISSSTGEPVLSIISYALPRTLFLFGGAVIVEYIVGVLVGRYIAWKRGHGIEGAVIVTSLFFFNMPSFWIGLILLFAFAYLLPIFPLRGFMSSPSDPWQLSNHYPALLPLQGIQLQTFLGVVAVLGGLALIFLAWRKRPTYSTEARDIDLPKSAYYWRLVPGGVMAALGGVVVGVHFWDFSLFDVADVIIHGFLPMLALVLISAAGTILLMQTSMLEVMGEDFILTARAKGLSERVVRKRHAARNAYLPVVTSLAISMGFVVGGAIILEYIFSYFGLGSYLLSAITSQDRFLAGSILFLISVLVIFGNIIADILYGVLDPRVRV
jgi:peptide/nickel transport system permease protein